MKKVMAGGVFNVIHPGHIHFLMEAKKQGDYLIVVIASDANKKAIFPATVRKKMIESLGFVDKVVVGSPKDKTAVIRREKPDVIALGYDQESMATDVPVKRIGRLEGYSTSEILKKIKRKR